MTEDSEARMTWNNHGIERYALDSAPCGETLAVAVAASNKLSASIRTAISDNKKTASAVCDLPNFAGTS